MSYNGSIRNEKQDIDGCLRAGSSAAYENLMLPKNLAKGDCEKDFAVLFKLLDDERRELYLECYNLWLNSKTGVKVDVNIYKRIRVKAGDVIVFASMIAELTDKMITEAPAVK